MNFRDAAADRACGFTTNGHPPFATPERDRWTTDDAAILRAGVALGIRHAPAPTTPASTGHLAASAIALQARRIGERSDLAHRPAALMAALVAWGRVCDADRHAGRALPEWPRWKGVPRSPHELSALLYRVDGTYDAGDVAQLAVDVEAWSSRAERMREGTEVAT